MANLWGWAATTQLHYNQTNSLIDVLLNFTCDTSHSFSLLADSCCCPLNGTIPDLLEISWVTKKVHLIPKAIELYSTHRSVIQRAWGPAVQQQRRLRARRIPPSPLELRYHVIALILKWKIEPYSLFPSLYPSPTFSGSASQRFQMWCTLIPFISAPSVSWPTVPWRN